MDEDNEIPDQGREMIVFVCPKEMRKNYGAPIAIYEVNFSFFFDEEIGGTYGQVEGRKYVLMLQKFTN